MDTSISQKNHEQRDFTGYIPMLLQVLLLLTVWPYLSYSEIGNMGMTRNGILLGTLLMFVVAAKPTSQWVISGLVLADTVVVSYVFGAWAPGMVVLPYPYFVILMMALLGHNIRHVAASVMFLCCAYVGTLYQHDSLTQQYLLLLPVFAIMAALVTCHVFQATLLATQAKQMRQRLDIDTLTKLPNRAGFIASVWEAMHVAHRIDTEYFAVLFLDLDGFKAVNDQLGHRAGDELLRGMAERLQRCLRKGDMLARYGGDEFCVLLNRITSKKEAIRIAERILSTVKMPIMVAHGRAATVGASIGIAMSTNVHSRPEDLIRDADAAMYQVKQRGKNGIAVSNQLADLPHTSSITPRLAES